MIYTESPRRKQITQQVAWGHWFALANIFMAIVLSSVYLFSSPAADTPLSFIYMLSTWFGHISFITFLVFVVVILPLCYQLTNMRVLRGIAAVVSAVGLALLAFDALIFNKTGFHITFSSAALLRSETQIQVSAFSWLQWFYLAMLFIIWLMFQLVVANAIFKRMHRLQRLRIGGYFTAAFVLCFISSHAIHVWADAKLYTPVLKQDNMFPLSYPATAKSLMARYGFLDLKDRQQREELQLHGVSNRFVYPPQNVFCSVNSDNKVVVLASTEEIDPASLESLQANMFHLNSQSSPNRFFRQLQYGIPANLMLRTSAMPVMLDLLNAFSVPNMRYSIDDSSSETNWETFSSAINDAPNGLYIGLLSAEQMQSIALEQIGNSASLMVIAKDTETDMYKLYSNFVDSQQASTNEDIAPTVIREFECLAEVYRFSTGQALQAPTRDWLVSTMDENIVYFKAPYLTKVAIDGSYEVTDIRDQTQVLINIDTNMLSRSIRHLENFSK